MYLLCKITLHEASETIFCCVVFVVVKFIHCEVYSIRNRLAASR